MSLRQYPHLQGLPWSAVTAMPPDADATVDEIMEFIRAAPWLRIAVKTDESGFTASLQHLDPIIREPTHTCIVDGAETQAEAIQGVWKLAWCGNMSATDIIRASGTT